jgi:hypothetical protein
MHANCRDRRCVCHTPVIIPHGYPSRARKKAFPDGHFLDDIASTPAESPRPKLDQPMGIRTILIFLAIMALGLFFAAYNIYRDISRRGPQSPAYCLSCFSASPC